MISYKENLNYGAPALGFAKAKQLRRKMTEAEEMLWKHLRNNKLAGCKFRRQHPLGIYIADFYCHQKKLVVEIDGSHHLTPDGKKYDTTRTFTINLDDIKVLRFPYQRVLNNTDEVLKEILEEIRKR